MIEFQNVTYLYGRHTPFEKAAVSDLSFVIADGMTTGIIGHTGSGKSTAAQMMNALLTPTSGKVLLDGKDIHASPEVSHKARFEVGLVFQYPEYQLFEETVEKDIAFGPRNMGLSEDEIALRVKDAMDFVGLEDQKRLASPFDLSGGQKRRVAIAGVIAMRPRVLVLDEPAAGLDPRGRREILDRLSDYPEKTGGSLVLISHSMEDIADYSDHILALSEGHLLCEGSPAEVFSHYDELCASGLSLPQVTTVLHRIAEKKPGIRTDLYTIGDAVRFLRPYLRDRDDGTEMPAKEDDHAS